MHRLFVNGYLTVTPEHWLEVSSRLRDDYHNGHTYYPFHGERVRVPPATSEQPMPELLRWHNEHKFLGT